MLEHEEGVERLQLVVSDFYEKDSQKTVIQEVDATPDELILLASCEMELIEMKYRLLPKINFFTEVCKIILDTLRHNWRTLDIYNQVAFRLFDFCLKFKCRKEFTRLGETLHQHYGQILKQ